jgi:hypothetical protein
MQQPHKFARNLGDISKLYEPEGWLDASSMVRTKTSGVTLNFTIIWRFLLGACEVTATFLCVTGKTAITMLETLRGNNIRFSWPEFVHLLTPALARKTKRQHEKPHPWYEVRRPRFELSHLSDPHWFHRAKNN